MIFVTLGTQKFPMNRLIDEIDNLVEKGNINSNEIIIQNGYSKNSKYGKNHKLMDEDEFQRVMKNSEIVICHGGTSSIIKALVSSKKVIAVPRRAEFNEHVDNHQSEIVDTFYEKGFIEKLDDVKDLGEMLIKLNSIEFNKYTPSGKLAQFIVGNLDEF